MVDIGYKSEGAIPVSEFEDEDIEVGNDIEVLLERLENDEGMVVLSKEKAAHKQNWDKIAKVFHDGGLVKGKVKSVVKGGLMVNVGVEAFLPGSQIDIIPPKDLTEYVGNIYEFKIVKINDERKNVVLSRREVIEAERTEQRQAFLKDVNVGDAVEGTVKNITDFGAFVDLQGMDGLLHITDISWSRVTNPAEVLNLGEEIEVKILSFDKEKLRVSLGLKQIQNDPWENVDGNYAVGGIYEANVSNITDYGCFAQLEEGIEGLIHLSELDWTSKNIHPSKVVEMEQKIKVMILEIDYDKRRISLGLKQTKANPWTEFSNKYTLGDKVEGQIKSITDFGIFVGLEGDIDGLIHLSDISDADDPKEALEDYKKGDKLSCVVFGVDAERERISLRLSE